MLCLAGLSVGVRASEEEDRKQGERIYRKQCAACHGASGEGSDEYKRALTGDRSVAQLSRLIAKTMPEDDPGTCVGPDADRVAAYIHEAFYSRAAQERNKPPRIEHARLTVRQYQNAVADLVGSFRSAGVWDEKRGLRGEYSRRRARGGGGGSSGGGSNFERIDPEVRFDFGEGSPDPLKMEAGQFSVNWQGSVLAPETGDYEFVVHTDHAMRLWVNDMNRPLIDALVKSGDDTEYRDSIRLLGGRAYPIRLEFSKGKQGVDDSKTNKPKAVKASIVLEWKRPHRPLEVIPARNLTPNRFPEMYVATTPFPPDDRSVGYERGTTISKAWDQATTDAAIEAAGYVVAHLKELAGGGGEGSADQTKKLREFCRKFAERAFRKPIDDEQAARYVDRQFEEDADAEAAVKRSVLLVLKSPRFLFRETGATPYDTASRLSFGLWDSSPDAALLQAAAAGKLATRDEITAQAERMVGDLRTSAKVGEFFHQWLRVDQVADVSKDPEAFPGFDEAIAADLRTSLDLFLDDVIWSERSDFRELLLADYVYMNGRLTTFYGGDLPVDAPFRKVTLDGGDRAGLLSHPYLMAAFAYNGTSSPVHRGVFIIRSVLGRSLRPPPEAITPVPPSLHAGLSTRERVTMQTSPAACVSCHGMINPLGFGLENFDAVGRYRSEEKGKPVDPAGWFETRTGDQVTFSGARGLAKVLAESEETHAAFIDQLFHYLVKQPVPAFGPRVASDLRKSFATNGYSIRKLIVEIVAISALPQPPSSPAPEPKNP